MTKKDFVLIANIIRSFPKDEVERIAIIFANELQFRFPNFKKDYFVDYCKR